MRDYGKDRRSNMSGTAKMFGLLLLFVSYTLIAFSVVPTDSQALSSTTSRAQTTAAGNQKLQTSKLLNSSVSSPFTRTASTQSPHVNRSLYITVDDIMRLFIDGVEQTGLQNYNNWGKADRVVLPWDARVIAVQGTDTGPNRAGVLASTDDRFVLTNSSWKCTNVFSTGWERVNYDDSSWPAAYAVALHQTPPWTLVPGIRTDAYWIWTAHYTDQYRDPVVYCRKRLGPISTTSATMTSTRSPSTTTYQSDINECETLPCYPFGTCTDEINDYSCTCNVGFTPRNDTDKWCDEIDECHVNNVTCLNGGVCHNYINGFGCDCPPQGTIFFYGDLCQNSISPLPTVVTGISKTTGILSGGAEITLYGTGFDKVPPIAVTLADTNNRVARQEPLIGYAIQTSIRSNSFVFVSPKASESLVGIPLTVVVILSGGNMLNTSVTFTYVENVQIMDILPRFQLATGGMQLTVIGERLAAVYQPRMTVELVVTYPNKTTESQVDNSRTCSIFNDSAMICQMPVFQITSVFFESNSTTESNNTANRKRRETHLQPSFQIFQPQNLYAQRTWDEKPQQTPLRRVSRSLGATIQLFVGLIFNNYPKYQQLNNALPNSIKVSFARPSFSSTDNKQQQEYDSSKEESLKIQGSNLALTCSINDYDVSVGMGKCNVSHLTNNYLQCSPPKESSAPNNLTASFCSKYGTDYLPVMVQVGTSPLNQNFAFCVRYKSNDDGSLWWIGVCVGVAVGLVILVVVIAVAIAIHKKRKNKAASQATQRNKSSTGFGHGVQRSSNMENINIDSFSSRSDSVPYSHNYIRPEHYWSNFNPENLTHRYQVSQILGMGPFFSHAMRHSFTRPYLNVRLHTELENNAHQLDRRYDERVMVPRISNDYRRTIGSENSRRILEADVGPEYRN